MANCILSLIGSTPLVELGRLSRLHGLSVPVAAKIEFFNPGGSVKDRIALAMVEDAEQDGRLAPGGTIVEPTSGNTGIGLALVCAVKGYRLILTMPETMSVERRKLVAAYGAEVRLTPAAEGMAGAVDEAERIRQATPGAVTLGQFTNPANPRCHHDTTGQEIWQQTAGRVDVFVAGIGTGGTLSGTGRRLKELNPAIEITREASKRYLDYMYSMEEAHKVAKAIPKRIATLRARECDPTRLIRSLMTDPRRVGNAKEQLQFAINMYCMASIAQDVDYLDCSLYDLFTPDELYSHYMVRNYQMYLEAGPSAEFGHLLMSDAVPLLRNFVEEADEAIATGYYSASLRYGHDRNVIPLVALMGVEGCDGRESDYRKVDAVWSCWRVTPMATNIQWIFYRKPGCDEILVKFLFNEREVPLHLESDLAPYYRWEDVKRYFEERTVECTKPLNDAQ